MLVKGVSQRFFNLPGLVSAATEAQLPGGKCVLYTLGPRLSRVFVPSLAPVFSFFGREYTRATGEDFVSVNSAPTVCFGELCVVAELKSTFFSSSSFRCKLVFDLDHLGADTDPALFDSTAVVRVLATWLNEVTVGDFDFLRARAIVISGSFPEAGKPISAHIIFDCYLAPTENQRYALREDIFAPLDERLRPFGVKADRTITSSGLKLAWMDKWDKDHWRGQSTAVTAAVNFDDPLMEIEPYMRLLCPITDDWSGMHEVVFIPKAAPVRAPALVRANGPRVIVANAEGAMQRIAEAVPEWAGVKFTSREGRDNCTIVVPDTFFCPNKHEATDTPVHYHGQSKKSWARIAGHRITIGCVICAGRIIIDSPQQFTDQQQAVLDRFCARYSRMGASVYRHPVKLNNGEVTEGAAMSHLDFVRAEQKFGYNVEYVDAQSGKRRAMKACEFWLEAAPQRFPYGMICDPTYEADPGFVNTWTGFNPPVTEHAEALMETPTDQLEAMCSNWLLHALVNVCGNVQENFQYLLNWCAFLFQHPGEKPLVALVLTGDQGSGKGCFVSMLQTIVGPRHSLTISTSRVKDRFNAAFFTARLLVIDESHSDTAKDSTAALKMLVTETNGVMERKYQDASQQKTFMGVILTSNHQRDAFANDEGGQRRFWVCGVEFNLHPAFTTESKDFFKLLGKECLNARAAAALYVLLMRRDLSGWAPQEFPHSEAEWASRHAQMKPVALLVYRVLCSAVVREERVNNTTIRHVSGGIIVNDYQEPEPNRSHALSQFLNQQAAGIDPPRDPVEVGRDVFTGVRVIPKNAWLQGMKEVFPHATKESDTSIWTYLCKLLPADWDSRNAKPSGVSLMVFTMPKYEALRAAWMRVEGIRTDKVFTDWRRV